MVFLTTLLLVAGVSAQEWSTFEPEGHGFSISMPGDPQEQEVENARMWLSAKKGEYVYLVAYSDIGEIKAEDEKDLLTETATANLEGAEATETARRTLNWQGWNAIECDAHKGDTPYFVRIISVPEHKRIYILTTIGEVSDDDMDKFVDSLEFTQAE